MKNIIVLFCLLFCAGIPAMAQSKYKTDVSLHEQIVNNSVPGATYKDATVTTKKATVTPQKSSGALLRENAVPGMKYKTSNTGAQKQGRSEAAEPKVASDKKAEKSEQQKLPEAPQLTQ